MLMLARNVDFARASLSACSRASMSSCSAFTCASATRADITTASKCPCWSRIGRAETVLLPVPDPLVRVR